MSKPSMVVFDLETTGLDPEFESILEIGAIAVDEDLRTIGAFETLVRPSKEHHLWRMLQVVHDMHTKSGLLAELANPFNSAPSRESADTYLFDWLKDLGYGSKEVVIAGHTIDFDHSFARKHLPQAFTLFSHRKFDFSATTKFFRSPPFNYAIPNHEMPHRALADAELELRELRAMRDLILSDRNFASLRAHG